MAAEIVAGPMQAIGFQITWPKSHIVSDFKRGASAHWSEKGAQFAPSGRFTTPEIPDVGRARSSEPISKIGQKQWPSPNSELGRDTIGRISARLSSLGACIPAWEDIRKELWGHTRRPHALLASLGHVEGDPEPSLTAIGQSGHRCNSTSQASWAYTPPSDRVAARI
ncbi:hypothetical protein BP5796_07935 [Coleophoma crateriformis]|uniref:Uncharacterized protein n=1 Tax=Coleophoma crateriformis TaxID=565419 RepID=A0A3D8RDD0_9HELO|nr:hypothetical protein BP5796_07935 [Coleophoma crateriformis]